MCLMVSWFQHFHCFSHVMFFIYVQLFIWRDLHALHMYFRIRGNPMQAALSNSLRFTPTLKTPTDEFPEWGASNFQCRDKWTGLKHSASDILTRKRQSRSCKDKSHLKPTYQLAQWEVRIEMCDFLPPVTFVCSTQTSNRGRRSPRRRRRRRRSTQIWKLLGSSLILIALRKASTTENMWFQ